jgi:dihydroflavonol-4-reductase
MILVTGGAGLLGCSLINLLVEQNKNVVAIYNNRVIKTSPNVTPIHCDILDIVTLTEIMLSCNITEVYHCAALVSFAPNDLKKLYSINVEGTANVVNACLEAKIKKLIFVSSVAALGRIRPGETINETMQWTQETSNSIYGHSKHLAEMEVWRGAAEGLQVAVVCPSIIIGYSNWNSGSTKLFKSVYEGFPYYSIGVSGFVDVTDVALAMIKLMDSSAVDEKFIISAENLPYQTVLNHIADGFNKKHPHKKVTPFLAALSWRVEKLKSFFTKQSPLITRETAQTALTTVQYDNSKFLNQFPEFKYKKVSDTIAATCKKLLKNVNI